MSDLDCPRPAPDTYSKMWTPDVRICVRTARMLDKPPAAHHLYQPSSVRYRSGVLSGFPITRSSVHDVLIRRHSLLYQTTSSSSP